jgi:hypothetical protein
VVIEGLPEQIEALGEGWQRKLEFHLTAISARKLEATGREPDDLWPVVTRIASGRSIGPIDVLDDVRRVTKPDQPGLRTLIVMASAPGLNSLYRDLSAALGHELTPHPAHITLYSSDPMQGIGIDDLAELRERAPELSAAQQEEARRAMRFAEVFFDDGGIPPGPDDSTHVSLGATDPLFTSRVMRAVAYAAHVHHRQRRKGTAVPYLAHLLSVAALVAEEGGGEIEVIGALLHDTAEDHGGEARLEDIRLRFGDPVERIVRALSDSLQREGEPKEEWRLRKERYLAGLREEQSAEILRVSNADKLHNVRSILTDHRRIGHHVWERFEAQPDQQLWYYRQLVEIFRERRPGAPLANEFAEAVSALERVAARTV